jgi:hypothetical protein
MAGAAAAGAIVGNETPRPVPGGGADCAADRRCRWCDDGPGKYAPIRSTCG